MRALALAAAALCVTLLAGGDFAVKDASAATKNRKPAAACPAGTTPIVTKRGRRAVLKRDRRGRLGCKEVKRSNLRAPAKTPTMQIGQVADVLDSAANINPKAFTRLERALGRRRADRLMKVALSAWRKTAGAASETQTFSAGGADGKATFNLEAVEGDRSGFRATASAEMKVSREDVVKYGSDSRQVAC